MRRLNQHIIESLENIEIFENLGSRISRVSIIILLAALLGSCHSSRHTVRGSAGGKIVTGTTDRSVDRDAAVRLVGEARSWLGGPYRYGGDDRRGVDCSGLTCRVFEAGAGVKLPRSSQQQKDYCRRVDRESLQPGDLVFFVNRKGGRRVNHVGMYVGDGRMIHASSSRGVMESDITSGYWDERYLGSGRVEAVTYASRGTRVPDGKADAPKPAKKQKKAKKGKKPATPARPVPERVPAPTPPPAPEVHIDDLPAILPAPAPAPAVEEPDTTGGWFD